jgi:histone deacetylase 1/2
MVAAQKLYRMDVLANLHELPFAPSVALQQVPKQSISDILAQASEDAGQDEDGDSDLDERIQSMTFPS